MSKNRMLESQVHAKPSAVPRRRTAYDVGALALDSLVSGSARLGACAQDVIVARGSILWGRAVRCFFI